MTPNSAAPSFLDTVFRPIALPLLLLAATSFSLSSPLLAQCGANSPAFPIPQTCRAGDTCTGNLWPTGFSPVRPGEQIPATRDSTQYITQSFPDAQFGHELFRSLDIVDGFLFSLYTNGLQVWNIGANAELPNRLAYKDGFGGHFLTYPAPGETDSWLEDIDAIKPTGSSDYLIGVVGRDNVGLSLWSYSTSTSQLRRLYQDPWVLAYQVRMVEVGGRVYAVAAADSHGVKVYDATKALDFIASGCLDNEASTVCSGVDKGRVGGSGELDKAEFLDLIVRSGTPYIAVADADSSPLEVEIWELANPAFPGSAVRKYQGGDSRTHGLAFFQRGGTYYLGAIHADPTTAAGTLQVFDVSNCLDAGGCTTTPLSSYGSRVFPGLPTHFPVSRHYLTYSTSGGDPFLYHGVLSAKPWGRSLEHLLDLSVPGSMTEITEDGGTYTEGCSNRTGIDYWGDYYEKNEHGLRNVRGAVGKFNGEYFYRSAQGILDIHHRTDSTPTPVVTTTVTSSAPYWFDEAVTFSATSDNCPGPENWTWNSSNTDATGLGSGGSGRSITWNLCPDAHCPSESIGVTAIKDACASDPGLIVSGATISVSDPRPAVNAINLSPPGDGSNQFPLCTELTFTADVDGRAPITLYWEIRDAIGALVTDHTGTSLFWDTATALPTEIFSDGFESGDTTLWGAPPIPFEFDIQVTATNAHDLTGVTDTVNVTLSTGTAAFEDPAFTVVDQTAGQFQFTAMTENATEFRWEFEDPQNGSAVGCTHYASCVVVDWSDQAQVSHHWTPPNVAGDYGATVEIRGCNTVTPPSSEVIVSAVPEDPAPPEVELFRVDEDLSVSCECSIGFCFCPTGSTIFFEVEGTPETESFQFDWENDGTFEDTFLVGQTVTHQFPTTGAKHCKVKAIRGVQESSPEEVDQSLILQDP